MIRTSCSWCHELNPASAEVCANCGHDAQRPRMACRCYRCVPHQETRLLTRPHDWPEE
jgi:hypothetical protein